jgi:glycosyltransferase involved in cell wall biosynthesis
MSSSNVRVAIDAGPLHGTRTGIGVAVQQLLPALAARPDVDVVPYLLSFRARVGADTTRLPLPAGPALRWWASARAASLARRVVDRRLGGVDVVHGTNYVVPPSSRARLVSVYDAWFWQHPELVGPDVRRRAAALRRAIDDGVAVHTSSQATADALSEVVPHERLHVVALGPIPLPTGAAAAPIATLEGRPFVVATGTIERRKNLPTLVRAFGRLAEHRSDVQLVIAGPDGDDRAAVDQAILSLPPLVAPRVHVTGWVDDAARGWLVRNAAVLAYPSLDEGFGFPLLDAMQAGVPIVASRVGSIPEVAGAAALLCAPDAEDQLAEHLLSALDPDTAAGLVAAGTERLSHYSWTDTAARLAELYHRLAEEAR